MSKVRICVFCVLILILLCILALMAAILYKRAIYKGWSQTYSQSEDDVINDTILYKFRESAKVVNRRQRIKQIVRQVNKRQYIHNYKNNSCLKMDTTVLVIRVHQNISYLSIFLKSIRQVWAINESLLIFAHDYFDDKINFAVRGLKCAKVMQIFYPHSIQIYPNRYPGEDATYCQQLDQCIDSRRRDPILVHKKLFWWWTTNEVFDYIKVLRNYTGVVYFIETDNYLSSDFIHMARMLEQLHPTFCTDCQILSLGFGAIKPRPEMYYPENSHLIISVWGLSNYSNSGIGFNRTTWNEIRRLKKHFCKFNDVSWEKSLGYLSLQTRRRRFYILSTEGPRFFPLADCGAFRNGTGCDLNRNYLDIIGFLPKINHGRFSYVFKLKFDGWETNTTKTIYQSMESIGQWGDARDIKLCMFFANKKRYEML